IAITPGTLIDLATFGGLIIQVSLEEGAMQVVDQTVSTAVRDIDPEVIQLVRDTFIRIYNNLETKK
ncbi:MAG: hypothetical protein E2604_01860, partial [Flavobacterium sp.]|nr:hypothetical protein [Flavobacterium sp.]